LDLDDSTDDGPVTYMLTIALRWAELRFEIAGPSGVHALSAFMRENHGRKAFAELDVGVLDGLPVWIIKDDEHPDRFFIGAAGEGRVRLTIVDPAAADLVRASEELAAEVAAG